MVEISGLKFKTSIGVLFALKEARGHKTLQETYAGIAKSDMENILDVMRVCYEQGENKRCSLEEFVQVLEDHELGFVKLTRVFSSIIEKLMYNGLSDAEVEEAKKQAAEVAAKRLLGINSLKMPTE